MGDRLNRTPQEWEEAWILHGWDFTFTEFMEVRRDRPEPPPCANFCLRVCPECRINTPER